MGIPVQWKAKGNSEFFPRFRSNCALNTAFVRLKACPRWRWPFEYLRVRERHDELLVGRSVRLVRWVGLEGLLPLPQGLDLELGRAKCVSLCRTLGGGYVQIGHFGRRRIGHFSVVVQANGWQLAVCLNVALVSHSSVDDVHDKCQRSCPSSKRQIDMIPPCCFQ
ncbi:hypothetical protein THAOC_12944 [Thalassiosira oceanica]|uniref:Uncharacterized protein n=1 Tax=Thalassiosira oceanica TaxID=159749 RepID=K0T6V9_THAOC|nr:hypothetical protein THAOC_12944 [Thalassiosira oceanica]|eukprot:EJK66152.1 hypothetical protein THAOC_12944 [Thalassiosira oceanica]